MTHTLPTGLAIGFLLAASELGMFSASRLYIEEIASIHGRAGVEAARDLLGREYPVFDAVASQWLAEGAVPALDASAVLAAIGDVKRVLFAGVEADALDGLVPALGGAELGFIIGGGGTEPEPARFAANYGGRLEVVPLTDWTKWVGARSALITFVYGADEHVAYVPQAHLRLSGSDVRTSFRSLVGWDLLGRPPRLHPRFLAETSVEDFSALVGAAG